MVFGGEKLWRSYVEIERGEGWSMFGGGMSSGGDGSVEEGGLVDNDR